MPEPRIIDYPNGVAAIDAEFAETPGVVASYLLQADGDAALVDVGSNFSVPLILRGLELRGVAREQVRYVCVTHVHLDHAGGAGELMRQLPQATLVVHPRGARHMIDPSALHAGARAIYGDAVMARHYGDLVPVPEERVQVVNDGDRLPFGRRSLLFLDTPGHANHHYSVVDEAHDLVFAGDTFGVSYRSLDTERGAFIFPSTSPVHFDPDAAHRSVDRLRGLQPQAVHVAHFGRLAEIERLAADLHEGIDAHAGIAMDCAGQDEDDQAEAIGAALLEWFSGRLRAHGVTLSPEQLRQTLAMDLEMNTQGLVVWLQRRSRAARADSR
ncbi:MBL fold metallo-hydrolase [Aquisalimonas asiatica]|uniref:Glyoxylase, beta-lactamase superfamily II n=1 Tax=Aquisalimonas asiatica TaxID=406100 RepID=A0A1H8UMZ3_9GAMM|nr:MBL fold metallo-hydrolase [Aquisalimonas asiatica]SEP04377.1 Glyoxylase, beta-lactamase superfamily II [Aquisalimonas asiatica]